MLPVSLSEQLQWEPCAVVSITAGRESTHQNLAEQPPAAAGSWSLYPSLETSSPSALLHCPPSKLGWPLEYKPIPAIRRWSPWQQSLSCLLPLFLPFRLATRPAGDQQIWQHVISWLISSTHLLLVKNPALFFCCCACCQINFVSLYFCCFIFYIEIFIQPV